MQIFICFLIHNLISTTQSRFKFGLNQINNSSKCFRKIFSTIYPIFYTQKNTDFLLFTKIGVYILGWSRRESNPRPNMEPMCFLHAYPWHICRPKARLMAANLRLIPLISKSLPDLTISIPDLRAPPYRLASEKEQSGDVLSLPLWRGLSQLTILRFRQQERSYFRQINFRCQVYYRAKASLLCMLTHRLYTLSNPVDPIFISVVTFISSWRDGMK